MRLYHGCPGASAIPDCRRHAPSFVHGACWTPDKMTPHDWPYFVDNGAFTDSFDASEWLALLDEVPEKMPFPPDFVVLPDELNDAETTLERHREYIYEVRDRGLPPAPVLQPGMAVDTQLRLYERLDVDTVFVGGEGRWQRAHGLEIIESAHERGMRVHVGNPGGKKEFLWWARAGVDSMDTTTMIQNKYWHWLEALEGLNTGSLKKDHRQSSFNESFVPATDGGETPVPSSTGTDRSCAYCGRELKDDVPVNRPIPVTVGRSTVTVCGGCWRSIGQETGRQEAKRDA